MEILPKSKEIYNFQCLKTMYLHNVFQESVNVNSGIINDFQSLKVMTLIDIFLYVLDEL